MNVQPQSPALEPQSAFQPDDEIDLREVFYKLLDHKLAIAIITAVVTLGGIGYAFLVTPVYESNILVQVEDSKGGGMGKGLLADASSMFDIKSGADAEMEILRSRLISARPVDVLALNIAASPRYFPLIGASLAQNSNGLSQGLWGYAWGTERIGVSSFSVPDSHLGAAFVLTAGAGDAYSLYDPLSQKTFSGRVGQAQALALESAADAAADRSAKTPRYSILVASLYANPGTQFTIIAHSRLQEIEKLQKSLTIAQKGKQSGVISVSLKGTSPQQIANILNVVAQEYLQQNIERKTAEAENSIRFLSEQLPELRKDLEQSESKYNQYRSSRNAMDLGEEGKALLIQATAAQSKLAELRQKRLELSTRYLAGHPSMMAIDSMLGQAQVEVDRVNTQIRRLPLIEQDALRLTRDMKVSSELYASLLQTMQQLKMVRAGKVGTVRLIDEAQIPEVPVAPKRGLIVSFAFLLGLFASIGYVLLRYMLRDTIEEPDQVEELTALPVFASIPHSTEQDDIAQQLNKRHNARLLAHTASTAPAVEGLRSFMTALQFSMLSASNNIILITGPSPGVGKSFIAGNFAAVLANSGKRVLLIDGDIRKGYLYKFFGVAQKEGLSEWIGGTATQEQIVHTNVLPHLDFITTGTFPPNPTELLRHRRLAQLLEDKAAQYDYVVIDAAPVLPVSDAAIIAEHVGTSILVVREGQTTKSEISESLKRLARSGIVLSGVLFNDLRTSKAKRRNGYTYTYGYSHES